MVIESAYADAASEDDWLDGILAGSRPLLDQGFGIVSWTFDARDPTKLAIIGKRHLGDDPAMLELFDSFRER